jgi:hypothetical protein
MMRLPQMVQYSALLHRPNPKGRKMNIKMKRGKKMRVMTADRSMRRRKSREAFGDFLNTGAIVLQ